MSASAATNEPRRAPRPTSYWAQVWWKLRKNRIALAGLVMVTIIALLALFAPWIAPYPESFQDPDALLQGVSGGHLMGTDRLGRDLFSRVLFGARVSMSVALITSVIAMVLGTLLGAFSGFVGGRTDDVLMRFVDVFYAVPQLLLVMIFLNLFGAGLLNIFLGIGLVSWVTIARLVREAVEQSVEMRAGLGAALGGEARRLVDDERGRVGVDHHLVDEGDLVLAELRALNLRSRLLFRLRLGRRDANHLPGLDPIARRRPLPIETQLPGPRPARHKVEARIRQVALEPAVEADPVILARDGELTNLIAHAVALANQRPTNSNATDPATEETA